MGEPKPFTIEVPDERLDWIRRRVAEYEWHEMPENGGWTFGTNLDYMKDFCRYWLDEYDWRKAEKDLNAFAHFTADVDGINLHYIREKGSGSNPQPLLVLHGWPGSIFEFVHIIDKLAHPEKHGGSEEDAFDVIVPSLPGYGFSGAPKRPIGPRKVAGYMHKLMTEVLGYNQYISQGGDWGSAITGWIGYDYGGKGCKAIHLNMYGVRSVDSLAPQSEEEKDFMERASAVQELEMGYFREQSTKPQTLSYGMMDSPVGTAAWILEKFNTWSDTDGDDIESVYTKDQLLTNIMIYLVTRTFNTATWLYRGLFDDGDFVLPAGERISVPVGVANFPKDFLGWPPRSMAERTYNVVRWTDVGEGGHFAAMEKPEKFVDEVRSFARDVR